MRNLLFEKDSEIRHKKTSGISLKPEGSPSLSEVNSKISEEEEEKFQIQKFFTRFFISTFFTENDIHDAIPHTAHQKRTRLPWVSFIINRSDT